jgi:hypothetical protein
MGLACGRLEVHFPRRLIRVSRLEVPPRLPCYALLPPGAAPELTMAWGGEEIHSE